MQDYYEYLSKGFRIIHPALTKFIGRIMMHEYHGYWWNKIYEEILSDQQRDLPYSGTDEEVLNSLDILNCLRIINRDWKNTFSMYLSKNFRNYTNELMGLRNNYAHAGSGTISEHVAERGLDTMRLICEEIDQEASAQIKELYEEVRKNSIGKIDYTEYTGIAQPESESVRGALKEGSLLLVKDENIVKKTALTRKLTYGGKTVIYPVYKVRLDQLYYNDQNDRIATWITQYESETDKDSLKDLSRDTYNRIIENCIFESNPDAIRKTQNSIALTGQNLPGVTLADGRVVDGNRRLTCLRRIQRDMTEPLYFETVIMDVDINHDSKEVKKLELAIQHGEENKLDYDQIDFAIGTYRDIVQNKLLDVKEYAELTNETPGKVRERIGIAEKIVDFLKYAGIPEQYHAAREYQVFSVFKEMQSVEKKLEKEDQETLKLICFNNTIMSAEKDKRKFIRNIKDLVTSGNYSEYFDEQKEYAETIQQKLKETSIHEKKDLDQLAANEPEIVKNLSDSMEHAMLRSRSRQLKAKPSENVSKCITLLENVDPRTFNRLDEEEKEKLKTELKDLAAIVAGFQRKLS